MAEEEESPATRTDNRMHNAPLLEEQEHQEWMEPD